MNIRLLAALVLGLLATVASHPAVLQNGCPFPALQQGIIFLPHESNCNQYYTCEEGSRVLQACPSDQHFNLALEACDLPDKAGCQVNPLPSLARQTGYHDYIPGYPTYPDYSNHYPSPVYPDHSVHHPIPVYPVYPEPPVDPYPSNCPGFVTGYEVLGNPHDCSTYFTCMGTWVKVNQCPAGLLFNRLTASCDWAEHVHCVIEPDFTVCPAIVHPVQPPVVPEPIPVYPVYPHYPVHHPVPVYPVNPGHSGHHPGYPYYPEHLKTDVLPGPGVPPRPYSPEYPQVEPINPGIPTVEPIYPEIPPVEPIYPEIPTVDPIYPEEPHVDPIYPEEPEVDPKEMSPAGSNAEYAKKVLPPELKTQQSGSC